TPQDRVYLVHGHPTLNGFALMPKSASLFRVPSILDYEPLVTRRYAEFSVMLRAGVPVRSLTDFLVLGPEPTPGFRRRLLDLAAVRYLIVAPQFAADVGRLEPPLAHLADAG